MTRRYVHGAHKGNNFYSVQGKNHTPVIHCNHESDFSNGKRQNTITYTQTIKDAAGSVGPMLRSGEGKVVCVWPHQNLITLESDIWTNLAGTIQRQVKIEV